MTDYLKPTGSSGTMLIRDLGSTVEFWLNSNNSTTFAHQLPYNWIVNGSSGSATYDYNAGSGWQKLRSFTVTSSQTVRFGIGSTGTSGFGGPTNFDQFIDRRRAPDPPYNLTLSSLTSTSVVLSYLDGYNGGAAIDTRQIGFGESPTAPTVIFTASNSELISGLTPGVTYYFWAQTHNLKGWSGWSARVSITTLNGPEAPSTPVISNIGPTTVDVVFSPNGDGGSPITEYELTYTDVPTPPGFSVSAVSPQTLYGLIPGKTYYVWARARNAVGWGPYSAIYGTFRTLAGARVKVGTEWKFAVPYVKDAGVWKIAVPYTKVSGTWTQTV